MLHLTRLDLGTFWENYLYLQDKMQVSEVSF